MSTKPRTENITLLPYRERVKLVRDRLSGFRQPKVTDLPKPARVLAAEKVVGAWNEKNAEHRDAAYQAWRAKRNEIEDALIVGDTDKAVKLLQQLKA